MQATFEIEKTVEGNTWRDGGFETREEASDFLTKWVTEGLWIGEARKGRVMAVS